MVEIKVNIELGVNAELKEFVTALLMAPSVHTGTLTTGTANEAIVAHLTKPRHRAAAMAAPAPEEKVEQETAPTEQTEQETAPTEQTEQEQPKSAITLPDLREAVKRLYHGGAHKEELPVIFKGFGIKNVTEAKEEQYKELFDTLNAKSKELGL
jgi:hypothetical protein